MQRTSFAEMECPIARAVDEIGEGWCLLVLREAFKGARCFAEFEERLGIPPSTLTRRLAGLCECGILQRRSYQSRPPRDEYELTEKGAELLPVLLLLGEWGNRWLAPGGALIVPVEPKTGARIEPVLVDRATSKPIRAGAVGLGAGPGASKQLRTSLRAPVRLASAPEAMSSTSSGSDPGT
ncbi:helix-turn-helix transcriptional regulator [Pendulispora brunnea]|uniref:Helix-turn-helix transcriptional regulator n=1 Tax=Pendulispora brunnea TaxID=2905690 RepID=A0ABZ2JX35_9BACT